MGKGETEWRVVQLMLVAGGGGGGGGKRTWVERRLRGETTGMGKARELGRVIGPAAPAETREGRTRGEG